MSEAKHTPGPWRYTNEPGYYAELMASGYATVALFAGEPSLANARRIVACVNACEGIQTEALEANARLIAAAPELLEALLVAHKHITEDRASYVWGVELPDGSMDTKDAAILHEAYDSKLAQIEAAIAKATAQQ